MDQELKKKFDEIEKVYWWTVFFLLLVLTITVYLFGKEIEKIEAWIGMP